MILDLAHLYTKYMHAYDAAHALLTKFVSEKPGASWENIARERLDEITGQNLFNAAFSSHEGAEAA
jgi:hypothetical protein